MSKSKLLGRVILKLFVLAISIFFVILQCASMYPADNMEFLDLSRVMAGSMETACENPSTLVYDPSGATVTVDEAGDPTITIAADTTLYYFMPALTYKMTGAEEKYLAKTTPEKKQAYLDWLAESEFGIRYGFICYGDAKGSVFVNGEECLISTREYLSTAFTSGTKKLREGDGYLFEIKASGLDAGTFTMKAYLQYDPPNRYYNLLEGKNSFDAIPVMDTGDQVGMIVSQMLGNVGSVPRLPQIFVTTLGIYFFIVSLMLSIPYWGGAIKRGSKYGLRAALWYFFASPIMTEDLVDRRTGEVKSSSWGMGCLMKLGYAVCIFFFVIFLFIVWQILIAIPSLIFDISRLLFGRRK